MKYHNKWRGTIVKSSELCCTSATGKHLVVLFVFYIYCPVSVAFYPSGTGDPSSTKVNSAVTACHVFTLWKPEILHSIE